MRPWRRSSLKASRERGFRRQDWITRGSEDTTPRQLPLEFPGARIMLAQSEQRVGELWGLAAVKRLQSHLLGRLPFHWLAHLRPKIIQPAFGKSCAMGISAAQCQRARMCGRSRASWPQMAHVTDFGSMTG